MEINVEIWVALISASALLLGYLIQRQNELKLKITEKKRDAYTGFLKHYIETKVAVDHNKNIDQFELIRDRKLTRNQLLLYASDNVIKAFVNWSKYWDENPEIEDTDDGLTPEIKGDNTDDGLTEKMLLEIRKDILGKTKLTVEDINYFNPFNRD